MRLEKKFSGFTLAEVLITLGIIGIVAALTLPAVINNYRKKVIETKLEETYTILSQMIKLSIAENGESKYWYSVPYNWPDYAEKEFFDKYFRKHVKITGECKPSALDQTNQSRLCATSAFRHTIKNSLGEVVNFSNMMEHSPKYFLPNGVSFLLDTNWGSKGVVWEQQYIIFIVDLHLNKNQAVFGRDIFLFHYMIYPEILTSSRYMYLYKGKQDVCTIQHTKNVDGCKKGSLEYGGGGSDGGCSSLIMCNGWKVPADYPIKL